MVGFVDAGLIASDWSRLPDQQIMAGTGFGIRIPFPMIDVVSLDLGWGFRQGKWNSPTLHWGIAQKFYELYLLKRKKEFSCKRPLINHPA